MKKKKKTDTVYNLTFCKEPYKFLYNTIGDNLLDYLHNRPTVELQKTDEDVRINLLFFLNFQNKYNSQEIIDAYDYFM